jgi:hypothetical protein
VSAEGLSSPTEVSWFVKAAKGKYLLGPSDTSLRVSKEASQSLGLLSGFVRPYFDFENRGDGADLKYRSGMLRAGSGLPQAIVQTDREKR